MRISVFVEGVDVSDAISATSIEINQNLSDRSSTARISFIQQTTTEANIVSYYDEAVYDSGTYSADVQPLAEVVITDATTGVRQFAGTIRQLHPDRKRSGLVFTDCDLLDWTTLLDEGYVESETFTGKTDREIIQALMAKYAVGLTALTANITSTLVLPTWEIVETPLREAIDQICEFTGCEYRVDYDKNFRYFLPTDIPAPFALSSKPDHGTAPQYIKWDAATGTWQEIVGAWDQQISDGGTAIGGAGFLSWNDATGTWEEVTGIWDGAVDPNVLPVYGIDAFLDYKRDAVKIINRAVVLGAVLPSGKRIRVQYDDWLSQQQYGVHPYVEVNDQYDVGAVMGLRAQAIVEQNNQPLESISLRTFRDGLQVGMSLTLFHAAYLISGSYLIREMAIKQLSRSQTEYRLTLGVKPTDTLRILKKIDARTRRNTQAARAVPVDGSVGDSSIMAGGISANVINSINAHTILGTIEAKQIGSVNAEIIAGKITSEKIDAIDAGVIQGVITADKIGSVNATKIEGVIVSSQLADGIIDSVTKMAAPLRVIPNLATAPILPNPDYPLGGFYYNTVNGTFWRNDGGTWHQVEEGQAVVGKLEYYHIGTVKAEKIVGLIIATQIDTINAGQIIGQLSAENIGQINASVITGTIDAAHIGGVAAELIQGSITSGQIASLSGTKIQVGTITSDKIASVNAASITIGQLTAGQIGTINAATITIGQIGDSQIGGVSASKLTAGTINANIISVVNLNADNITTGSFSASRIGAGTISASISITSPSISGASITGGSITGSTMTVNGGSSSVFTGPAITDPTYGSVAVKASDTTGSISFLMSRGLIVQQSGSTVASINRSPTDSFAGEMTIYNGTQLMIFADGHNGIMRATGFQTNNLLGNSITINYTKSGGGAGFMIFSGGILTSSG